MIPVSKPKLASHTAIFPYLKEIDNNRWYSNNGPLLNIFRERLAVLFNCGLNNIVALNSATSALSCLLYSIKIRTHSLYKKKYCLMPSWTFIATAAAAVNAGFIPYFVDVNFDDWMIDPKNLENEIADIDNVGAIIVTSAFGRKVNVKSWIEFSKKKGIPVIIDAAASFDSIIQNQEFIINDTVPIVVSLHATKIFGIGEGGLILSKNQELISLLNSFITFGFNSDRNVNHFGINAKLSEYSAAIGLAMLDMWPQMHQQWHDLTRKYKAKLDLNGIKHDLSETYLKSTCNIIIDENLDKKISKLKMKGIDCRKWWNNGCHREKFYQDFPKLNLKNTEKLAASVLGIPFFIDLKEDEISNIVNSLLSDD